VWPSAAKPRVADTIWIQPVVSEPKRGSVPRHPLEFGPGPPVVVEVAEELLVGAPVVVVAGAVACEALPLQPDAINASAPTNTATARFRITEL